MKTFWSFKLQKLVVRNLVTLSFSSWSSETLVFSKLFRGIKFYFSKRCYLVDLVRYDTCEHYFYLVMLINKLISNYLYYIFSGIYKLDQEGFQPVY